MTFERRIDDLGRIIIPKEIRSELKLTFGAPVNITLDEESRQIIIKLGSVRKIIFDNGDSEHIDAIKGLLHRMTGIKVLNEGIVPDSNNEGYYVEYWLIDTDEYTMDILKHLADLDVIHMEE